MTIRNRWAADRHSIPPLRGWDPADIPDSLWRVVASPYMTMLLLAGMALLLCLALFLPQRTAAVAASPTATSAWLAALRERYNAGANLLLHLGLADIRRGGWLRGCLGLLVLNLVVTAVDLIYPRHLPRAVLDSGMLTVTVPRAASQRPEDAMEHARQSLLASRFRLVQVPVPSRSSNRDEHSDWLLIHADRFVLFPLLVFLGVILSMGGLVVSERTTWWEQNVVLRPDQVRSVGHGTGLALRAEVLDRNGEGAVGLNDRWQTRLTFLMADREVRQAELRNQRPTVFARLCFYPVSTEPALLVEARDRTGQNLALRTPETGATDFGQVSLRFRDQDNPRYIVTLDVSGDSQASRHLEQTANQRYVLVPDRNVTLRLTYRLPTEALAPPMVHVEAFRGAETVPFEQFDILASGSVDVEGDVYAFELQRYAVVKYGQDYGGIIALLGLAIALVGIALSAWRPPQRLWLATPASQAQAQLLVALNRSPFGEGEETGSPWWFESVLQGISAGTPPRQGGATSQPKPVSQGKE
jgi:hypothetical protein